MVAESINPLLAEFLIILGGFILLYGYLKLGRDWFGPEVRYWGVVRRGLLPWLDRLFHKYGGYAEYPVSPVEYVGTFHLPDHDVTYIATDSKNRLHRLLAYILQMDRFPMVPDPIRDALQKSGYEWNHASATKVDPDGNPEIGSFAQRDGILDDLQTHVMLFEVEEGVYAAYAHKEDNSLNPFRFVPHYFGGSIPKGIRNVFGQEPVHDVEAGVHDAAADFIKSSEKFTPSEKARGLLGLPEASE